ncbi:MAG: hypothetical protein F6J93_33840 [Oscillatoria sp. SIO1A7]|nr:hypothetical protein [Oscillatoria sp. SIO1A7]
MTDDLHLRVFRDRSELIAVTGETQCFLEGSMSQSAKERYQRISQELANGYFENKIIALQNRAINFDTSKLSQKNIDHLNRLVNSVTSEVGRALVGITVLQLCVKAIEPRQSIRLHKGSSSRRDFSWQEGISMRSLDKQYITPTLRKYDLLKLNADGFMMTRSLAENYPYSPVYKAKIRGARLEWSEIVESIEALELDAESALDYLLSEMLNRANDFQKLAQETVSDLEKFLEANEAIDRRIATNLIWRHVNESDYAARVLEIAIHSLMQAMQEGRVFPEYSLKPLSQMRSANKKHGNIGDIELLEGNDIVEAWDAKYGKAYLRDELDELAEKLKEHPKVELAGFVTSLQPERLQELEDSRQEIEDEFGIYPRILTFEDWVEEQFRRSLKENIMAEIELATAWLIAYAESLAQRRRDIAPIDEPCQQWLIALKGILDSLLNHQQDVQDI